MMKDIWSYQIYEDIKAQQGKTALWGITKKSMDFYCEAKSKGLSIDYIVDAEGVFVKPGDNGKINDWESDSDTPDIESYNGHVISIALLKKLGNVNLLCFGDLLEEDKKNLKSPSINFIDCSERKLRLELTAGSGVYIYGAGLRGQKTIQILRERNVNVQGFIDADVSKHGNIICGRRVCGISEVPLNSVIVISAAPYKEIYNNLTESGIDGQYICVDAANSLFLEDEPLIYREFYGKI